MKEYGRIRYVNSYEDAPVEAYVIREMQDHTVRLEHYWYPCQMEILKEYPYGAFSDKNFNATLVDARKLMANKQILWVERSEFL